MTNLFPYLRMGYYAFAVMQIPTNVNNKKGK